MPFLSVCFSANWFLVLHFTARHISLALDWVYFHISLISLQYFESWSPCWHETRGGVLHIVNMQWSLPVMDAGVEPCPVCDVTLGLLLHGWALPRRIFLYSIGNWLLIVSWPAYSHLIPQARTSFLIHQRLIERVWRAEPAPSDYFATSDVLR